MLPEPDHHRLAGRILLRWKEAGFTAAFIGDQDARPGMADGSDGQPHPATWGATSLPLVDPATGHPHPTSVDALKQALRAQPTLAEALLGAPSVVTPSLIGWLVWAGEAAGWVRIEGLPHDPTIRDVRERFPDAVKKGSPAGRAALRRHLAAPGGLDAGRGLMGGAPGHKAARSRA